MSNITDFPMFIDGKDIPIIEKDVIYSENPATGEAIARFSSASNADVDKAVAAAKRSFDSGIWSQISGIERSHVLYKTAQLVQKNRDELAHWESLETGKPLAQAKAEIGGCVDMYSYAAGLARTLHGETQNNLGADLLAMSLREPLGVVAVITPWNFPFLILSERIPYILAAGCSLVVKPSELTSITTLLMGKILQEAGLADGVYNVVTGAGNPTGEALCKHDNVDMISFTGSTKVGQSILRSSADGIKKVSLELGGKSPFIIFDDAPLDEALDAALFAGFFNSGQCCISGNRLLIQDNIADDMIQKITARLSQIRLGDPKDENTQLGPIVNAVQYNKIHHLIKEGEKQGAKVIKAQEPLGLQGRYVAPMIVDNVKEDNILNHEEVFGPVIAISRFSTIEEAIAIANSTKYGLAAYIWSQDIAKAIRVARSVKAGRVWVNSAMESAAEMPIGGYKQSGLGREAGLNALMEYTEVKALHIHTGDRGFWL